MTKNLEAFLDMVAWSEIGTEMLSSSSNGYNLLVGSLPGRLKLFYDYSDHPRVLVKLNDKLSSTAAGRYQILKHIFDYYKKLLKIPDFSPSSQDAIAIQLIRERNALPLVESGRIVAAIGRCNNAWASLTGSPYGQHTHSLDSLITAYRNAGGIFAS